MATTNHDPAHATGGAAAETAAKATIWSIAQEAVGQVRDAIGRLMRGTSGEGGNQTRLTPDDPEFRNLDDKLQHELRQFVGSDSSAEAVLEWTRYGVQLLARVADSEDIARAVQAQRTIGGIRLVNAGQVTQFAKTVSEAHGRGGDSEAVLAALAFADIFSPADPQTGAAVLALSRVERMGRAILDGIRGLPARLTPAVNTLARVAGWTAAGTAGVIVLWLCWIGLFGAITLFVGANVNRFDDWMWVILLAVVGYILPTAVVPALLSEGVGLVLGAVYGIGAALQGTLRALGADLEPLRRDEHHETLAQRVSDFRGKLILPAALGVATWFTMWCLLFPSGASSMVVALAGALLGAAAPWILKGGERDAWAKQALVVTTLLVAIGLLAAVVGAPPVTDGGIGAYKGGLLAAPLQALAHGVWRVLGVAGGQAETVASQGAYGSALVFAAVIAVAATLHLLGKGKVAFAALAIGLLLWVTNQGDREVAMAPVPSGVSAEERALEAAEVASMEREEAAAQAVVYHRSPISPRAQAQREAAIARAMEAAVQTGIAMEREHNRSAQPTR